MRERYLTYHHNRKGIQRVGTSIPLATGSYTHLSLEGILKWCQKQQQAGASPRDIFIAADRDGIVRNSVEEALQLYTDEIDNRGWRDLTAEDSEELGYVVEEQTTLTGALVWCWYRTLLPTVLDHWDIVAVEQEYEYVIGCTCGLSGLGEVSAHAARDCSGLVLMTRPDLIITHREREANAYVEFKTGSGVVYPDWAKQFNNNMQFAMGCAAAERIIGKPIDQMYVHGMHKGSRRRPKDDQYAPKRQESGLCYAFYKEANPPLTPMDVSPSYYKQVDGKNWGCTPNRGYEKKPVWEIPFEGEGPFYERYVKSLSYDQTLEHVRLVGPINNNSWLMDKLFEEMLNEEDRWHQREVYLEQVLSDAEGDFADEAFQQALNQVVPRSWDCKRFGEASICQDFKVCFEEPGWDQPLEIGYAVRDEPNHPIENMRFEV